jgi:hypothetical protein
MSRKSGTLLFPNTASITSEIALSSSSTTRTVTASPYPREKPYSCYKRSSPIYLLSERYNVVAITSDDGLLPTLSLSRE